MDQRTKASQDHLRKAGEKVNKNLCFNQNYPINHIKLSRNNWIRTVVTVVLRWVSAMNAMRRRVHQINFSIMVGCNLSSIVGIVQLAGSCIMVLGLKKIGNSAKTLAVRWRDMRNWRTRIKMRRNWWRRIWMSWRCADWRRFILCRRLSVWWRCWVEVASEVLYDFHHTIFMLNILL